MSLNKKQFRKAGGNMDKEINKFDLNEVIIEGIIKEKPTQDPRDGLYKSVITVR